MAGREARAMHRTRKYRCHESPGGALAAMAMAALLSTPAHAGRPLQTEDAGVLDRGECELEIAFAREGRRTPALREGHGQVACGVGLQSQLALAYGRIDGDGRADILGASGKTALRPLTDDQTGVTLAWGAGFLRPRGGGFERDAVEVRAVVTHPVGPWFLHGNVGWLREADHTNRTVWGAAVERTATIGAVDAMFEFFGDGHGKTWANAGLRWNVAPERFSLDGSYGRHTSGGASLMTVGMKLLF